MGYSAPFVENYNQIVELLQKDEEIPIQVVGRKDSICSACPHQSVKGCAQEEKIQGLDERHAQILKLNRGDIMSWREAKQRLIDHMTLDRFHQACSGCEWKCYGICETALKKLRSR